MTQPIFNLDEISQNHRYDLKATYESEADGEARRENDALNASLERKKSWWLFVFALLLIVVVIGFGAYLYVSGTVDDKKWVAAMITSITSGLIGYLVGQSKK